MNFKNQKQAIANAKRALVEACMFEGCETHEEIMELSATVIASIKPCTHNAYRGWWTVDDKARRRNKNRK